MIGLEHVNSLKKKDIDADLSSGTLFEDAICDNIATVKHDIKSRQHAA